jgi:hypothetical protein
MEANMDSKVHPPNTYNPNVPKLHPHVPSLYPHVLETLKSIDEFRGKLLGLLPLVAVAVAFSF